MSIDTRIHDVTEVLKDEQYYAKASYERLINLLVHILPIGQKYKIWGADEDPAEALEVMENQLRDAVDSERKALLRLELKALLEKIRTNLERYQRALSAQ